MAQIFLEIAKEITIEAIKQQAICLPDTNSYEEISDINQKRTEEIAKFFKAMYTTANDAFNGR